MGNVILSQDPRDSDECKGSEEVTRENFLEGSNFGEQAAFGVRDSKSYLFGPHIFCHSTNRKCSYYLFLTPWLPIRAVAIIFFPAFRRLLEANHSSLC